MIYKDESYEFTCKIIDLMQGSDFKLITEKDIGSFDLLSIKRNPKGFYIYYEDSDVLSKIKNNLRKTGIEVDWLYDGMMRPEVFIVRRISNVESRK